MTPIWPSQVQLLYSNSWINQNSVLKILNSLIQCPCSKFDTLKQIFLLFLRKCLPYMKGFSLLKIIILGIAQTKCNPSLLHFIAVWHRPLTSESRWKLFAKHKNSQETVSGSLSKGTVTAVKGTLKLHSNLAAHILSIHQLFSILSS